MAKKLLTVSRQLGHASISTTADVYCHAVPGSNKAAADALEQLLKPPEPGAERLWGRGQVGTRQQDQESS